MAKKAKVSKAVKNRREFEKKMREYRAFLRGDADYDWHFIIRLLRYKLERTRKHIAEENRHDDVKKTVREINEVVSLLKRLEAEPYHEEVLRPFFKRYGRPRMISGRPNKRALSPIEIRYSKESSENRKQLLLDLRKLGGKEKQLRLLDLRRAFV